MIESGIWDVALIMTVAVKGTLAAYIRQPRLKASLLVLPIPFTLAVLALGQPVNVTHVTGLAVLLAYTFGVKFLHKRLRLPIVWAILVAAVGYCIIGSLLAAVIPKTDDAFLLAAVGVCVLASILHYAMPHPAEPAHSSPLSPWKKFASIFFVLCVLVSIKSYLQGFMTVFPMLGVIIAYESRFSLYSVCRYIPVAMLTLAPMMATIYVLQDHIGLGWALAGGWLVYLIVIPAFILPMWSKYEKEA